MANNEIFTRVYSTNSTRRLVSGKGPQGSPLDRRTLLHEFSRHANKSNREPTALVSVSSRIVDTIARAFSKRYHDEEESPENIWFVFITIPEADRALIRYHSAWDLAHEYGFDRPERFKYEFVFEWAIPKTYISHKVSLETLMDRGLGWDKYHRINVFQQLTSTAVLQSYLSKELQIDRRSPDFPWDVGVSLGHFAQHFGARAPLVWIAHQLFRDCLFRGDFFASGRHREIVYRDVCRELDEGIDTVLIDWWLTSSAFISANNEFEHLWDTYEWAYHTRQHDTKECEEIRSSIEAKAVAIGL